VAEAVTPSDSRMRLMLPTELRPQAVDGIEDSVRSHTDLLGDVSTAQTHRARRPQPRVDALMTVAAADEIKARLERGGSK